MPPDILTLPLSGGALFVVDEFGTPGTRGQQVSAGWRIHDVLARNSAPWRLRSVAVALGVEEFDPRQRTELQLHDQIERMVEMGRLKVRFLPLFRDDPRGPSETGPLRLYQLGSGPSYAASVAPASRPSSSLPTPSPTLARSKPNAEKDFLNEPAQAATLIAAATKGQFGCEVCKS